jgi:hypothetical protein
VRRLRPVEAREGLGLVKPERARELRQHIRKGSEIEAMRARCNRCLQMRLAGELLEGRCEPCTVAAREEVSQGTLRLQVFERDGGVCVKCGQDMEALRRDLDALKPPAIAGIMMPNQAASHRYAFDVYQARIHGLIRCGFDRDALESGASLWEAHHERPQVSGGASVLSGTVTVCIACHKSESKKLAKDRAKARRPLRRRS